MARLVDLTPADADMVDPSPGVQDNYRAVIINVSDLPRHALKGWQNIYTLYPACQFLQICNMCLCSMHAVIRRAVNVKIMKHEETTDRR